jgi:hypothetical protein
MTASQTDDAARQFLAKPWVAMVAVAAAGRGPLNVPIWYSLDEQGRPWFVSPKESLKSRLIVATSRFTLTAQRESRPYAYVSVEGTAVLETAVYGDIRQMAARYLGDVPGTAYADSMREKMDAGTRFRITLEPERWSHYGLGE